MAKKPFKSKFIRRQVMMDSTPPSQGVALRNLVIILLLAITIGIFSYGWSVTDIDLAVPQEPQRQTNLGEVMRDLFSPNIFSQDYTFQQSAASFLIDCAQGTAPAEATATTDGSPYIIVSPTCGAANEVVTVRGYNFSTESIARIEWIPTGGEARVRQAVGTNEDNFVTDPDGSFTLQIEVPQIRGTLGETHTVQARVAVPTGLPHFSDTAGVVMEKMVETIFLALIATAISILPSAILSFFAAHNLMKPIRMALGNLLVSFALLPVGWWLGWQYLSKIGELTFSIGSGALFTTGAANVLLVFAAAISTQKLKQMEVTGWDARLRSMIMTLLAAVGAIALIGLIGGLGITGKAFFTAFGDSFRPSEVTNLNQWAVNALSDGFTSFGSLIGTLGDLIHLMILPIAAVIGAFSLSSVGTTLTIDALKRIDAAMSHVLGGILGAISGAILLGVTAQIGSQAAWLGLLTPIVAGWLGGAALTLIYRRILGKPKRGVSQDTFMPSFLTWIGGIATFIVTFVMLGVWRAVVEGTLPPRTEAFNVLGVSFSFYVAEAMLIGAILAGIAGALAGTRANFPLGEVLYNTTRTVLNGLRSIEPLIMGLVFVIWVGIGPFAGVLALTLHSIASLGKLYSEQIENIDSGPIEALQSTGANQLQTIMYAVVPQIIPPYIAFTMYRWDINVRMSTIIGFVGGGGVGFLLQQQINLLRYREAGVAVLAIAIVVAILDYASATIRQRYV
jgi:phosphonate ABC transporter permease subunit PhnE